VGIWHSPREATIQNYVLLPNYPNPFNPGTTISYRIPSAARVTIAIYNVLGQRIRTLVNQVKTAGEYTVYWDGKDELGRDMGSGIYYYTMKAGKYQVSRKMLLVR
jgi:flagellar hook assembly protein FlgD